MDERWMNELFQMEDIGSPEDPPPGETAVGGDGEVGASQAFLRLSERISALETDVRLVHANVTELERRSQHSGTTRLDSRMADSRAPSAELARIEEDIREIEKRIEDTTTGLRREMSSDREQVVHKTKKNDGTVERLKQKVSKTECEVQALCQWRRSIAEQVEHLHQVIESGALVAKGPASVQMVGEPRQVRNRMNAFEEKIRTDVDIGMTNIERRINNLTSTMASLRDGTNAEIQQLHEFLNSRISDLTHRMETTVANAMGTFETRTATRNDQLSAEMMHLQDKLQIFLKETQADLRQCQSDISRFQGSISETHAMAELAMSLLSDVERKAVSSQKALRQHHDTIKTLLRKMFIQLFDRHIQPLKTQMDAMIQVQRKQSQGIKSLMSWKDRLMERL